VLSLPQLIAEFGVFGRRLYDLCRGVDEREVCARRRRKSSRFETTCDQDIVDLDSCLIRMTDLLVRIDDRLRSLPEGVAIRRQFIKIRFSDFVVTTVERAFTGGAYRDYLELCKEGSARGNGAVRLLGVGVRFVDRELAGAEQLRLDLTN
jgi:DNA polymerase-4